MNEKILALIETLRERGVPIMTHEEIMRLVKRGKVVLPPVAVIVALPSDEGMAAKPQQNVDKEDQGD